MCVVGPLTTVGWGRNAIETQESLGRCGGLYRWDDSQVSTRQIDDDDERNWHTNMMACAAGVIWRAVCGGPNASREKIPGIAGSVFATVDMEFHIRATGASFDVVDQIIQNHACSVVSNLSGVTHFTKTTVLN
jgi:hypothetical protein